MALDAQWSAVARGYRLALVAAAAVGAASVAVSAGLGHWVAGIFICIGLGIGGWNSRRLWQDTEKLAATEPVTDAVEPGGKPSLQWRGPAATSSAKRLGLITVFAVLIALVYRPLGWTVFLGLVAFQLVMLATVLPPLKRVVTTTSVGAA